MSRSAPLLSWFYANRRDLPWRRTDDPYAIWVSESMLQQTQVTTVIPYYHRFLARFPTVESLARADLESVLKLWEGLGYYSRCRNLHKAAGLVVTEHGGRLPNTVDGLRSLPGIGPYMAGAVGSIAFGLPEPVLDGNVERVLTRLHAIDRPAKERHTQKALWALAREMLPVDAPGDFNEAMMELGATVCTVKSPDCNRCPLASHCVAHGAGNPTDYPVKLAKKATPHHDIAVALVRDGERWLMVRRPESGLLGGLWEFPGGRCLEGEPPEEGVRRVLADRFGLTVAPGRGLAPVRHVFTHRKVTLHPFACQAAAGLPAPVYHTDHRWLTAEQLTALALPRAHQKIAAALQAVI